MNRIVTTEDIKKLGTILSVWAHPDDESFLAAGVISAAAQNGQTVACVTATKGEAGSQDPKKWPPEKLAEIRAGELAKALEILGVKKHFWLGYRDGSCCDVPTPEAVQKLSKIIQEVRPDSILTFGPDGWTGHDDHRTMYHWVQAAVQKLDKKPSVYCVVHTPNHYEKYFKPADEALNLFFNIDMPPLLDEKKCDIYFVLPPATCVKKCDALAASPSQTEALFRIFNRDFVREAFAIECFILDLRKIPRSKGK